MLPIPRTPVRRLSGSHSARVPSFTSACTALQPAAACACHVAGSLVTPGRWGPGSRGSPGPRVRTAGAAGPSFLSGDVRGPGSRGPPWAIGPGSAPFLPIRAATCQCPAAPPGSGAAPACRLPRDRARARRLCVCVPLWAARCQEAFECEGKKLTASLTQPAPESRQGGPPPGPGGAALGALPAHSWVRLLGRLCTLPSPLRGGARRPSAWYPAGASSSGGVPPHMPPGPAASHTPKR